jgi:hypothetical protein
MASVHAQIYTLCYHDEATDFRAFEAVLAVVHADLLSKNTKEQGMDQKQHHLNPYLRGKSTNCISHPVARPT